MNKRRFWKLDHGNLLERKRVCSVRACRKSGRPFLVVFFNAPFWAHLGGRRIAACFIHSLLCEQVPSAFLSGLLGSVTRIARIAHEDSSREAESLVSTKVATERRHGGRLFADPTFWRGRPLFVGPTFRGGATSFFVGPTFRGPTFRGPTFRGPTFRRSSATSRIARLSKADGRSADGRPGEGRPGEGRPGEGRPGEGRPADGKSS
ncbi:hypothetical protein APED_14965 [Acanthopleuribacter pedis]